MIPLDTLYLAAVAGAVAMVLILRPRPGAARTAAVLVAIAAFGAILSAGLRELAPGDPGTLLPTVFGAIAVIAAVRMISLSRPVLAALHFVVVVLASSAMFLLLQAEFMAFALIIVYAGAILITYLFVLMLARPSPTDSSEGPFDYDALPREPVAACVVGFVLLATVSGAVVRDADSIRGVLESPAVRTAASVEAFEDLESMPKLLDSMARDRFPGSLGVASVEVADGSTRRLRIREVVEQDAQGVETSMVVAEADVLFPDGEPSAPWTLSVDDLPGNTRLVGMKLVASFPISLELAGVILLMAMYGAVVLARRQIELGEDERREAAGLRPLSVDDRETSGSAGGAA
jgi:NADH-quinone oxidoreductase subunit J